MGRRENDATRATSLNDEDARPGPAFKSSRIKRLMQRDEDVGKIATATPVLVAKALECLMTDVLRSAAEVATDRNTKTVQPSHLKQAIDIHDQFDFLRPTVAAVPSLEDADAARGRTRKQRAKRPRTASVPKSGGVSGSGGGRKKTKSSSSAAASAATASAAAGTTADADPQSSNDSKEIKSINHGDEAEPDTAKKLDPVVENMPSVSIDSLKATAAEDEDDDYDEDDDEDAETEAAQLESAPTLTTVPVSASALASEPAAVVPTATAAEKSEDAAGADNSMDKEQPAPPNDSTNRVSVQALLS